jgi:hypothetical protein
MGTTAGVLYALDVSKGVAVNFSLASGLLLTGAALVAAAFGLAGSLLLTFRARQRSAATRPASVWNARTPSRRAGGDLAEGALYVSGSVGRRLPDAGAL